MTVAGTMLAAWGIFLALWGLWACVPSKAERGAREKLSMEWVTVPPPTPYARHRRAWERTGDLTELWAMVDSMEDQ